MRFVYAFIFSGFICAIAQVIVDNTKLTTGHVTTLFTVVGSFLSFIGLYPKIINLCGAGATILITNFGNLLYLGGINGYQKNGILGIFTNLLSKSSLAIVSSIIFSFVFTLFFKPKD